jgi:hypothetical protein
MEIGRMTIKPVVISAVVKITKVCSGAADVTQRVIIFHQTYGSTREQIKQF